MRTRLSAIVVACGLAAMVACSGGGSSSPTSPTSPTAPLPVNDPVLKCPAQGFEYWDEGNSDGTVTIGAWGAWVTRLDLFVNTSYYGGAVSVVVNGVTVFSETTRSAQTVEYVFPSLPTVGTTVRISGGSWYFELPCTPGSTTQ